MTKELIGKFIRDKRSELKLTQTELAEKAKISYRCVLDIELNKRNYSIDVAIDLLASLGYDLIIAPRASIIIEGMKYNFKLIRPAEDEETKNLFKK